MLEIISEAYNVAVEENGYDLDKMTAEEVATDLVMYCPCLEDADYEEVLKTVIKYRGY